MINKTKIKGIEVTLDDGDSSTEDITFFDKTYCKEKDAERVAWLKKQLACHGYTFKDKVGVKK